MNPTLNLYWFVFIKLEFSKDLTSPAAGYHGVEIFRIHSYQITIVGHGNMAMYNL